MLTHSLDPNSIRKCIIHVACIDLRGLCELGKDLGFKYVSEVWDFFKRRGRAIYPHTFVLQSKELIGKQGTLIPNADVMTIKAVLKLLDREDKNK